MTIPAPYSRKAPPQPTAPTQRPSGSAPPTPIINPYVKTGNIKKSFVSLTKEAEKYSDATKQAQNERDALLQRLTVAQQRNKDLLQELRVAQDNKGTLHRQVQLWENQHKTLERHLAEERQISQQLTDDLASAAQTVKEERASHLHKMNALNMTLKTMLRKAAEERYESLLHPQAVEELGQVIHSHNASSLATRDTQDALQAMEKAGNTYYTTVHQVQALWEEIKNWRRSLTNDNVCNETTKHKWTEEELDKLEDDWIKGNFRTKFSSPDNSMASVQLFRDSTTAKYTNRNKGVGIQEPPSVHMEVEDVLEKDCKEKDDATTGHEMIPKGHKLPPSPSSPNSMDIEKVVFQDVDNQSQADTMVTEQNDEEESPSTSAYLLPNDAKEVRTPLAKHLHGHESKCAPTDNTPKGDLDMDDKNET